MVAIYADEETRFRAMDIFTLQIMEEGYDFKAQSDEEFAASAYKMETISRKARAYQELLNANPKYKERLMNKVDGDNRSDLERVMSRLESMLVISDYYRARKALMTDPYYILHYNDEMSADPSTATTPDQKRVAELISLVAQCGRRLSRKEYRSREDSGMERVLAKVESRNRQAAHITGQPDITLADPDAAHKHNLEIKRFVDEAEIFRNTKDEIADTDDKNPYPKAAKYYTKGVKNYFDAVKLYSRHAETKRNESRSLNDEQRELHLKLINMFNDKEGKNIHYCELNDPVTGEIWKLTTDIQRITKVLALQYVGNKSNEEMFDMFEGLILLQKADIDMKDPAQRLYARERFLDSLGKLFTLQYENMKRYESTYGTLCDDLPIGVFLDMLGAGQKHFIMRNLFGQDMANLIDKGPESQCIVDGEKLTVGELLVKYNRIPKEMLDDAMHVGVKHYVTLGAEQNGRYLSVNNYSEEYEDEYQGDCLLVNFVESDRERNIKSIGGPKISFETSREMWKKSLKHSDDLHLVGGVDLLRDRKNKLDLYTDAEKDRLKKSRKRDAVIKGAYTYYLSEVKEKLLEDEMKNPQLKGVDKKLLEKLIVFHPAMLSNDHVFNAKAKNQTDPEDVERFYASVRKIAGVGVDDKDKAKARAAAFHNLVERWNYTLRGYIRAESIEDLMEGKLKGGSAARDFPNEIVGKSKLMYCEVSHMMYESIKSLAVEPGLMDSLSYRTKEDLNDCVKKQLQQEIWRNLISDSFYLDLKDIGNKKQSYSERMYDDLYFYASELSLNRNKLDKFLGDEDFKNALEYFGVSVSDLDIYSMKNVAKPVHEDDDDEDEAEEPVKKEVGKAKEEPAKEAAENKAGELVNKQDDKAKKKFKELVAENEIIPEQEVEEELEEEKEIKEDTKEEFKELEDGNNIIIEEEKEEVEEEKEIKENKAKVINIVAPEKGEHVPYEGQQGWGNYCWACAMNGMMNAFAGKKVSTLSDITKRPLQIPTFKDSGISSKKEYKEAEKLIGNIYKGIEYGSPAMFGDYIQQKLPGAVVRTAFIGREKGRMDFCKGQFLDVLQNGLKKGPVAMMESKSHYVLIKEIQGDKLLVYNSLNDNPDEPEVYYRTLSQIFGSTGQQVELVWLENMEGREEELAKQFGVKYDANTDSFSSDDAGPKVKNKQTILHRNGFEATLEGDAVFNFAYFPNHGAKNLKGVKSKNNA